MIKLLKFTSDNTYVHVVDKVDSNLKSNAGCLLYIILFPPYACMSVFQNVTDIKISDNCK